jgi:hypothetical protein
MSCTKPSTTLARCRSLSSISARVPDTNTAGMSLNPMEEKELVVPRKEYTQKKTGIQSVLVRPCASL